MVGNGIFGREFDCNEVFVYEVNLAGWSELGERDAERTIATAKVEYGSIGGNFDVLEQQMSAFIDSFGTKKTPG